ncbi:putative ribonuclease H-like domain-containing protein [Tanacetum coccineum]
MAKQAELNNRKCKGTGQRENRPVWNNVQRLNHQNQFVPTAVLIRNGKIQVNTARASSTNNVNTAEVKAVSAVGGKRETVDYPQRVLQNKGIVDSGCSRHMTGNKVYLAKYQDFNGGPIAFGASKGYITGKGKIKTEKLDFEDVFFVKELQYFNLFSVSHMRDKKNKVLFTDTEYLVLSPEFKLPDENQVLLRIPKQNNMYSFNLENIVPSGGKGPNWLFDLDYLTDSMNYQPVRSENQANKHAGPKEANHSAAEALRKEFAKDTEDLHFQAGASKASGTNTVNTSCTPVSTASPYGGLSFTGLTNSNQDDSEIPALEEIYNNPTDGIFTHASYDDEGAVADFTNLETIVNVSPIPTSRINSIHPSTLIFGDPKSAVQTRSKVTQSTGAYAFVSFIQKQRRNSHKDFQHYLFACFLSQNELKKISEALEDESWVDAMQEELLQFKIQKVWILVDLPYGKKAIRIKWVYRNKKDERGVVVRNKARIEAIRIFLAFASYMGFIVYQMDVKSAFLYGKIDEEVYVSQPPSFVDPKYPKKVDYEILDKKYPIIEWKTKYLGTKQQFDETKRLAEINLNVVIRSNGQKRYFSTLMRVLSIFDREDINVVYKLVMDRYQDEIPEGVHTLMTDEGLVIHMLVEKQYPLRKKILVQMLELTLESEEDNTMALELIRFVKKLIAELEPEDSDGNEEDL